ncbi:MAG: hypothetical protein ACFCD0_27680 [Gemmataceae bacterium]
MHDIIRSSFVVLLACVGILITGCTQGPEGSNTSPTSSETSSQDGHCPLCDAPSRSGGLSSLGEGNSNPEPETSAKPASEENDSTKSKNQSQSEEDQQSNEETKDSDQPKSQ